MKDFFETFLGVIIGMAFGAFSAVAVAWLVDLLLSTHLVDWLENRTGWGWMVPIFSAAAMVTIMIHKGELSGPEKRRLPVKDEPQ
jgi:CDP-diglyceride synthetase